MDAREGKRMSKKTRPEIREKKREMMRYGFRSSTEGRGFEILEEDGIKSQLFFCLVAPLSI